MAYIIKKEPLTIYEYWEKNRWRTDSIYLMKNHILYVPIERTEIYKSKITLPIKNY